MPGPNGFASCSFPDLQGILGRSPASPLNLNLRMVSCLFLLVALAVLEFTLDQSGLELGGLPVSAGSKGVHYHSPD